MAKEAQDAVDRGDLQPRRGDHPVDDAARAARPERPERLAPPPDRGGSGTTLPEVNRLVKQFGEMQKLMKQLSGAGGSAADAAELLGRR